MLTDQTSTMKGYENTLSSNPVASGLYKLRNPFIGKLSKLNV